MAKPDGQLTLPGDFGRKWATWYIATVRDRLRQGLLGNIGFHKVFSDKLESHVRALSPDRDLVLRLTEEDKGTLCQFTMSHSGKLESQQKWMACIYNKWEAATEKPTPVPADELKRAKEDLAKPYIETPFVPVPPPAPAKVEKTLFGETA